MNFLAITSYYNPFKGNLRKSNYEIFRKHLGVKLLTVEWSRDADFDLCEGDADYLIQVSNGDLLWQKERLFNIGLAEAKRLGYSRVVFLDSDIVFHDPEWFVPVNAALDTCSVVQCFSVVHYLPLVNCAGMRRGELAGLQPDLSAASLLYKMQQHGSFLAREDDKAMPPVSPTALAGNPGMAVAIRIDAHSQWKKYEGNIVGGGDSVLMAAATNQLDHLFTIRPFTKPHQDSIRAWKAKYIPDNIQWGCAENQISHLWHGELEKRKYVQRYAILIECGYDPERDLNYESPGALTFSDSDSDSKLRKHVFDYLFSRNDH